MSKVKYIFVLISCIFATVQAQNCSEGFDRFEDSCYYFVRSQLGWYDADQYCTSLRPKTYTVHLASIESQNEQNWIADKIRADSNLRDRSVWIGLNNADKKEGWLWTRTYQTPDYKNWGSGQPVSSGRCSRMHYQHSYRWHNTACSGRYSSVCEYSLTAPCPKGFDRYQNSCYKVIPTTLDWFEAEQFCTYAVPDKYNVHLASIESSGEQQFIVERIRADSANRNRDFWVGGNRIDSKKNWAWVANNKRFSYTNWNSGEPSGSGQCMWLDTDYSYRWNDKDCNSNGSGFVCEVELADLN
ncbi:DgyrCDS10970 [Dimorphilus gyrociliatus]|uniref:DgyrCDS10970 n=1 Tax=Dimorphilus gyrociliatus TaxID=2664684 RepID=A0A7I8W214_9ANNE|nr:DgyrCDS10970 [Dimorphilus gyrociliatus]